LVLGVADSREPARIDMKSAVLMERGLRDPTQQRQDRKVMRHDDNRLAGMAACDALHRLPDPLVDLREALAARDGQ
jgi:hypothetical protein